MGCNIIYCFKTERDCVVFLAINVYFVVLSGIMWRHVGEGKSMLRGINAVALDTKGRMAIPTQYRERFLENNDGAMVVTIDTEDRCLMLYPADAWQEIEDQLAALPTFNPATRRIQRLLIGHASDLTMDKNGRILVPPLLREYAGLDKNVILLGQGKRFEIWGESQWELGRDSWLAVDTDQDGGIPPELMSLSL